MALFIVEAQLSDAGLEPITCGQSLGHDLVFVTNRLKRYAALSTFHRVLRSPELTILEADTGDSADVIRAILGTGLPVDGVFTMCDYNLPVVAETAAALGRPGLRPDAAWACRDKLRTRRALAAAGLPAPKFVNPVTQAALHQAVEEVGLPCVVKPMTESASVDVRLCYTAAEAVEHYRHIVARGLDARGQARPGGALVEEYLLGYEVSVECLWVADELHVLCVTDKGLGSAPVFTEIADTFPSILPEAVQAGCRRAALDGLNAVGHDFGCAHVEMRVVDGTPTIIEINARLGGDLIPVALREVTGTDFLEQSLRLCLGEQIAPPGPPRRGVASYYLSPEVSGRVTGVRGVEVARSIPGVRSVTLHVREGDVVQAAVNNHATFGYVVAVAETPMEAARICDVATSQICITIRPEEPATALACGYEEDD